VLVLPAVAVLGGLVVLGALRTVTKDMERAVSRTVVQSEDPTDRPTAGQSVER
jgi:hypothetical protein